MTAEETEASGYWSREWAEIVGSDGHIITDILGRIAPNVDDQTAARFKSAEINHPGVRRAQESAARQAWHVVDAHGLRTALAQAKQAAKLVAATHAPYDRDDGHNDRWHQWQPFTRALDEAVSALVVRRPAPDLAGELAALWVQVMGDLPPLDDLDPTAEGLQRCYACNVPNGTQMVSAAEAAQYARRLLDDQKAGIEWAKEDAATARRMLAEHSRTHVSRDDVREALLDVLGSVTVPAKAREAILGRFGIGSAPAPPKTSSPPRGLVEPVSVEQGGLFDVDEPPPSSAAVPAPRATSRAPRVKTVEPDGALL